MSKIALEGNASGTGTFTLASPNSSTDRTLTLPDESGTVLTSASSITQNTGPAFSVTMSANQNITSTVATKAAFNTVQFDTDSCYDTVNYRFTPNIAGYYQINQYLYLRTAAPGTTGMAYILKNSTDVYGFSFLRYTSISNTSYGILQGSDLIYMNGSTDYIEVMGYITGSTPYIDNANARFTGALVRAA